MGSHIESKTVWDLTPPDVKCAHDLTRISKFLFPGKISNIRKNKKTISNIYQFISQIYQSISSTNFSHFTKAIARWQPASVCNASGAAATCDSSRPTMTNDEKQCPTSTLASCWMRRAESNEERWEEKRWEEEELRRAYRSCSMLCLTPYEYQPNYRWCRSNLNEFDIEHRTISYSIQLFKNRTECHTAKQTNPFRCSLGSLKGSKPCLQQTACFWGPTYLDGSAMRYETAEKNKPFNEARRAML